MWWIELAAILIGTVWALQLVSFLGMLAFAYAREWPSVRSTSRAITVRHKHARRRAARQKRVRQRQFARA